MKKFHFLFSIVLIFGTFRASCQLIASIEEYYKLDETTGQAVNSVNPGVNNSSSITATQGVSGIIGNAYSFDGVSQRIDFTDHANWTITTTSSLSVSVWIYLTGDIASNGYANLWGHQDGPQAFLLKSSSGNYKIGWYAGNNTPVSTSAMSFSFNTWYHIVITKNGSSVNIYRNSNNVGSLTATDIDVNPSFVYIGADGHSSYEAFKGRIDELGIWKRALTTSEVTSLYNNGSGLAYPFGESPEEETSSCYWQSQGDTLYYNAGKVGIGTSLPTATLTVNGTIYAKEIEVNSSIISDFVFEPEYELMPLTELEIYLRKYNHLPGIPSVAEFSETGQDLGETDDMLLRKIEELTLYIIKLKKEIEILKQKK